MNIAVFGTGMVGQIIASALAAKGHSVMMGTRDVRMALERDQKTAATRLTLAEWHRQNPQVRLGIFAEAAALGEVIFNATNGFGALPALESAGEANLDGKILIDISNPLDFSQGMPPTLFISNTDSLGEQIQRRFPGLKVVKTLNTVNAYLMVNPQQLAGGDHTLFVSGNDLEAKARVTQYLRDWFGWKDVIDLGDITTARGTEMLLPIWVRLWGALQTPVFNFKVVRQG
ncbi:MAG TPA: NAD(P)-binding domain-containing protein [Meiothermus sp.]|nr:NAD(P)-binding domain-containing protein [Meiothermus sp.]